MILCKVAWVGDSVQNIFFSCPWLKLETIELLWRTKAWDFDIYLKDLLDFLYAYAVFKHCFLAPNLAEEKVVEWLRHSIVAFESLIWYPTVFCVIFGALLGLSAPQFHGYFKDTLPCFWENYEDEHIKDFCSVWAFLNGGIRERDGSWPSEDSVGVQKKNHCRSLCLIGKISTSVQHRWFFSMASAIVKTF